MEILLTNDSLFGLSASTANNRWEEEISEEKERTFDYLFFLFVKNMNQTNNFLTRKKGTLLKEEFDIIRGPHAIAGIAGLVPLCNRGFVVISWALIYYSWISCGSEVFSLGYFVAWISRLQYFQLLAVAWQKSEIHKYI